MLLPGRRGIQNLYAPRRTPDWRLKPEAMKYISKCVLAEGGISAASSYRSSLPNALKFKTPVLLVAGGKDRIVDWIQSKAMAEALESSGRPNELVLNPEGGHMVAYAVWANYATNFLLKRR